MVRRAREAVRLTPGQRRMFEEPNFAHLATILPGGAPHVTPVWVDVDNGMILVNTAVGRVKERNVRRDPRVGISVHRQENPYAMVSVTGRVEDITSEGADRHIDALAKKYLGKDRYPYRQEGERRVILRIRPDEVRGTGA